MKTTAFVFSCILIMATRALAAVIIDQNQPNGPVYMAGFSQPDLAQSFQQANDNISGSGILLQSGVGVSDLVTISLWDALPSAGGSMLASASGLGTAGSWVDVFWSPVSVVPDTTLFLVFTSAENTLGIAGDISDPYSRGQTYANLGYSPFPHFDYAFRTYAESGAAGVPDTTGTFALVGLAFLALISWRRNSHA